MNVLMPQLGETVAEGTVANWHKKVGDTVAVDELLFDVETDKVSMEVPAIAAGVITKILVPAGTTVDVGTVLAVIDSGAEATASTPTAQPAAPAPQSPPAASAAPTARAAAPETPPSWYAAMPPSMNEAT
jgi:2-oxoglutarate dehydrogenase E2 component (dihydrolipoamide succinyltransferase)